MRILIAAALSVFVFGGCATMPMCSADAARVPNERLLAFQEGAEKTTSTITITRDVGIVGSGCYVAIRINGVVSALFDFGETSSFYVEPGETLLSVGYDPLAGGLCGLAPGYQKTIETNLRPGETKFYRLTFEPGAIGPNIIRSDIE